MNRRHWLLLWLARLVVGTVFFFNVTCALPFVAWPDRHAPAFEVSGVPGHVLVRGIGVLFLMWNATYPPVLARPDRNRTLFAVILVQQAIGLAGETWMWVTLPSGYDALWATGLRFIAFDGAGLVGMGLVFWLLGAISPHCNSWYTCDCSDPGQHFTRRCEQPGKIRQQNPRVSLSEPR